MKSTYLVQRLKTPLPCGDCGIFTFGGGLRYGGLNKEAFDLLNTAFSFDYMGSAEFEFGEVQKSLSIIQRDLNSDTNKCIGELKVHGIPVYYTCNKFIESGVKTRIKELSAKKCYTKESVLFDEALAARVPDTIVPEKKDKYKMFSEYIGWIELDNHFMFFLDKDAFDKVVALLT